jgi:uncharacterized Rmd1/YagE family protein
VGSSEVFRCRRSCADGAKTWGICGGLVPERDVFINIVRNRRVLSSMQEQDVLRNLVVPCEENPLPPRDVEVDEFQFHYTASEKPNISNDTITINHRFAHDHLIKLSISHALSQSTKLCVFEERVMEIVQSTKDLPELLASTGDPSA